MLQADRSWKKVQSFLHKKFKLNISDPELTQNQPGTDPEPTQNLKIRLLKKQQNI